MTEAHLFAFGLVLAWLAGIRAYLTVFGVGLAGALGWMDLPPALEVAQSPWVLGVSGTLALVEFFADKIPGVDSIWDLLHTLLRVPAGAFLAAAALSPDGHLGAMALAGGAAVALTSHGLKSGTRALLNASPEPFSNWTASATEDAATVGGLALVFHHPVAALALVIALTLMVAVPVWFLWRRLRRGWRAMRTPGSAKSLSAAADEPGASMPRVPDVAPDRDLMDPERFDAAKKHSQGTTSDATSDRRFARAPNEGSQPGADPESAR